MRPSPQGPRVPSPFVAELLAAFLRRRKAIKYRLKSFEPRLEVEAGDDGEELQLLHVEARTGGGPESQISLKVWEDGELWFQACRPGPRRQGGWAFLESFHGSVGELRGPGVVKLFEESLTPIGLFPAGGDIGAQLRRIWRTAKPE